MENKILIELKKNFLLYDQLLHTWQAQNRSSLTDHDIFFLSVHAQRNFVIALDEKVMFYNREEALINLNEKLTLEYPSFKMWVKERLLGAIAFRNIHYEGSNFLYSDIDSLKISKELKISLLRFNVLNAGELYFYIYNLSVIPDNVFKKLVVALGIFLREEKIHFLKEEVYLN